MTLPRPSRIQLPKPIIKRPRLTAHGIAIMVKSIAIAGALLGIFLLFKIQANTNLLAQQAKNTAERNQAIAKVNGRHIDCIADLFATYTRDQKPIAQTDLDKCQITEAEAAGIVGNSLFAGAVDFTMPLTSTAAPAPSKITPSQNNNTIPPTPKSENPTQPTGNQQASAPEPRRLFGIPLCAPDPLSLIHDGACVTR